MEDLFSDLSSISDCDDECLLKLSRKKSKCFFIKASNVDVVCSFPPAYRLETPDPKISRQKRLEEKSCESDTKNEEKIDKWVQTDEIPVESKLCLVDLPPCYREAEYNESALERILRHISAYLHRTQLKQWLSDVPERNASFSIRPVQAPNIFQASYNSQKSTFVLLLSADSRYFVELRSLKNLMKSVDRELIGFNSNDRLTLFSSHQFIGIFSSSRIIAMDIDIMDKLQIYDVEKVVSMMVVSDQLCFINERGGVFKLDPEKSQPIRFFNCSPLLCPIITCSVISDHFYIISPSSLSTFLSDSPLDYESYESENVLSKGPIIKLGEDRLLIFNRKSQICSIWETDKPVSPSHTLCFGSSEHTVDVACDNEFVYSLSTGGAISLWKLRPNGRKYRFRLFTTFLPQSIQLLLAFPQKFAVQTHNQIYFLVFANDSETNDTMK